MQTKKASFLKIAFELWISNVMDMADYMTVLEALMLKYNVRWNEECDVERSSITENFDVCELFEFHVNCEAYNEFSAFERFCTAYMDFSKMDTPKSLHLFLNLN